MTARIFSNFPLMALPDLRNTLVDVGNRALMSAQCQPDAVSPGPLCVANPNSAPGPVYGMMLSGAWCGEISGRNVVGAEQHISNRNAHLTGAMARRMDEAHAIPLVVVRKGATNGQAVHAFFRIAINVQKSLQHRAADACLLQELSNCLLGNRDAFLKRGENARIELMNRDLGIRYLLMQVSQSAKVIDMAVRDDDPLDVGRNQFLAELGPQPFQPCHQLCVGVPYPTASIDESLERRLPAAGTRAR